MKILICLPAVCLVSAGWAKPALIDGRLYEFVWANRTADDRPVLLPLTDAAGLTVAATNAVATFAQTTEHRLFGDGVTRLTYRTAGKKPGITLRPPAPVPVAPGVDTVSVWVWGNRVSYARDASTPAGVNTGDGELPFPNRTDGVDIADVRFGALADFPGAEMFIVPYWSYSMTGGENRPHVACVDFGGTPFFCSATMDWTQSNGSAPWCEAETFEGWARPHGGVRYNIKRRAALSRPGTAVTRRSRSGRVGACACGWCPTWGRRTTPSATIRRGVVCPLKKSKNPPCVPQLSVIYYTLFSTPHSGVAQW